LTSQRRAVSEVPPRRSMMVLGLSVSMSRILGIPKFKGKQF
jgi:hypothetical protein